MKTTPEPRRETRRGRPPKGASQLTRAAIVTAALKVIDVEGIDSVSMRSVARILGVDAKSLYNHIADKDDLLDAVAEHLLGSMRLPIATGDLRVDLLAIAQAFRDRALAHPQAAPLVLTRQLGSFEGLAPVEAVLAVLRSAGFEQHQAVQILRSLIATLIGTLLREVHAGPTYGTTDADGIAQRQAALEDSGLARVTEAAADLARFDSDAEYQFTLDLILDAVAARLA
ncbi:TetR/AcrR family transcriptional regulator [Nocardioides sp. YJ-D4]